MVDRKKERDAHAAAYAQLRLHRDEPRYASIDAYVQKCVMRIAELERFLQNSQQPLQQGLKRKKWMTLIRRWSKGLSKARRELIQKRGQLENLQREQQLFRKKPLSVYLREYEQLCAIPRVHTIEVQSPNIVITTDVLYSKDDGTSSWHRIGYFRITCNLIAEFNHSMVLWENLSGISVEGGYVSPTRIEKDGKRTCVGTALVPMRDAHATANMVDLVSLLVRFPESPSDGGVVKFFPKVRRHEVPEWYLETFG